MKVAAQFHIYKFSILFAIISIALYVIFAYDLARTNYFKLLVLYVLLWVFFMALLKYSKENIKVLGIIAFLFRAVFILAIPNLSQDFYRFIWDGRMILEGLNPYLYTPEVLMASGQATVSQAQILYEGMGQLNASHFTNYPPIKQFCFLIAALFSGHSILGSAVVLRLIIIAADFGTFFYGRKLLRALKIPEHQIFWYLLNPFIIIELTGNLHFEGVMIFFLVWSLYLLHRGKWQWAAVVFALSISVKLVPLLFLPLLFKYFVWTPRSDQRNSIVKTPQVLKTCEASAPNAIGLKRLLSFYGIVGIVTLVLFAPFFSSEFVSNYSTTVALWFNNFEFNASIYYLARAIGYWVRGYNEIAVIGKILPLMVFLIVMVLSFFRKNILTRQLITNMLFAFACYLFLSTTVHPWYLTTLLILSVFTNYRFPLVWSFVIILSYLAYINLNSADKSENLWVIALEYSVVYLVLIWELFFKSKIDVAISD